jgi:YVTN family beta-propeller protein
MAVLILSRCVIGPSGDSIHGVLQFIEESQLILPYNFNRVIAKEFVVKTLHIEAAVIILLCIVALFFGCAAEEDSMEKFAYIANHYGSSVSVIDIEKAVSDPDNAVVTTVSIPNGGESIKGIALSPDKQKVFVPHASMSGDSLWIFSAEDYVLTGPIQTGTYSVAVDVTPDGDYAYVVNNYDNTVSVVSTESDTVVSTVDVGTNPQNIAFSPDGLFAYVTNKGENSVSVIDTTLAIDVPLAAVVRVIAIAADPPKGLAVTPDGKRAFVATAGGEGSGNKVAALDLERMREIDIDDDDGNGITAIILYESTQGAPRAVAITPDGAFAYVSNLYSNPSGDDTVSIIDAETYEVVGHITVGDGPKGIVITSNGKYALVANAWGNTVSVIDIEAQEVISTIEHEDFYEPIWIAL